MSSQITRTKSLNSNVLFKHLNNFKAALLFLMCNDFSLVLLKSDYYIFEV